MNKRQRKKAAKKLAEKEWTHVMMPLQAEDICLCGVSDERVEEAYLNLKAQRILTLKQWEAFRQGIEEALGVSARYTKV